MEDCLDDEDGVATGGRLLEVVDMLGTHGLIPAAQVDQTSNGNQTADLPPSIDDDDDIPANDSAPEVSQQPAQVHSGGAAPPNGMETSADNNEVFVEDEFDFMAIARRAAQSALNPHPDEPSAENTHVLAPSQPERPAQSVNPARQNPTKDLPARTPTTPPQSNPTDDRSGNSNATLIAQYEEARAFAAQRSQQKRMAASNPSSARRPWTEEEENTLMRGLDQLHGPFWAQILELYGEYGTHSTILRGRTQVQLKDKARNLKLYFLKNDLPVPDSLRHVTGVLKPKAPGSQDASKTSSEERTS